MSTNPENPEVIGGSTRLKCLPTYLVLDTSSSMEPFADLLNECLREVHRVAYQDPDIPDFAHMSIISFNTDPHLVLPMSNIRKVKKLPRLACGGLTSYAKAFDLVRERINEDVPALAGAHRRVQSPALFFMTDGLPTDGMNPDDQPPRPDPRIWKAALSRLTDPAWERRPHIISFGFGNADASVLGTIGTLQAFIADSLHEGREREALKKVFATLLKTLSGSATAGSLQVPTNIPGFVSVPIRDIH